MWRWRLSPNHRAEKGDPAHAAAANGSIKALQTLVRRGGIQRLAVVDPDGNTPAHAAAAAGRVDVLRFISSQHPALLLETNSEGYTPAHLSARDGQKEVLSYLAEQRGGSLIDAKCLSLLDADLAESWRAVRNEFAPPGRRILLPDGAKALGSSDSGIDLAKLEAAREAGVPAVEIARAEEAMICRLRLLERLESAPTARGEASSSSNTSATVAELRLLQDKGLDHANEAVAADRAGRWSDAIANYCRSAEYLLAATGSVAASPQAVRALHEKALTYARRAREIGEGAPGLAGTGGDLMWPTPSFDDGRARADALLTRSPLLEQRFRALVRRRSARHLRSRSGGGRPLSNRGGCRSVFLTHDWGIDAHGRSNHERVSLVNARLKVRTPLHNLVRQTSPHP